MLKRALEESKDGRTIRRRNNTSRIVNAMLDLVREGAIAPRADQVATRAGVGLRTVFRHFDDMETLYRQMADAMERELKPLVAAPLSAPDWKGRLAEMIERRARLFERAMPFKSAADVNRHRSPFLRRKLAAMRTAERAALEATIRKSIKRNAPLREALDLVMSFGAWQHLRREQKLSLVQARRTIEAAVRALAGT
jgi:AcrR family transcriptional regulator